MAGTSAGPPADAAAEEAAFCHESDLNSAWAGSRLAIAALSLLFGSFLFAYFTSGRSTPPAGGWAPDITRPR